MRYLLIILLFVSFGCAAQRPTGPATWYWVADTAELRTFPGPQRSVYVVSENAYFNECYSCVVDNVTIFPGFRWRNWRKMGSGSSTPYVDSLYQDGTTLYWTKNGNTYNFDVGDVDELDFRTTTQLTDTSFTLNRPNGTRDTVEFQLNYVDTDNLAYVDSIWRVAGKDSIFYQKQGETFALLDSTGGSGTEPIQIRSMTIESPGATENIGFFYTDVAVTISKVNDVLVGSSSPSVSYQIKYASLRGSGSPTSVFSSDRTITSTSGDSTTSFANASIPAGRWVWVTTSAMSGTVTQMSITIKYTND